MEIPTYNGICSRCESIFRAPIKSRDGPIYCSGCSACTDYRNGDLDLKAVPARGPRGV